MEHQQQIERSEAAVAAEKIALLEEAIHNASSAPLAQQFGIREDAHQAQEQILTDIGRDLAASCGDIAYLLRT